MLGTLRIGWAALALGVLAGAPALAGDYYVDAAHGNDSNQGTSPEAAWCTVPHAVSMLETRAGEHTLHLTRGVYEASNLVLQGNLTLTGAGAGETVLDGGGGVAALDLVASHVRWEPHFERVTIEGLTLRNAGHGVRVRASMNPAVVLREVAIEGCDVGVALDTASNGGGPVSLRAVLDHVWMTGNGVGLAATAEEGAVDITIVDSSFIDGAADGIRARGAVSLSVTRCRLIGNGGDGIDAQPVFLDRVEVVVIDTLIARNHGAGFRGDRTNPSFGTTGAAFSNVTVAENCEAGILSPHEGETSIVDSILYGNLGPDLVLGPPGISAVRSNVVGDEELDGVNGNVAADPLFRDAATSDYRLSWGSPAVDASDADRGTEVDLDQRPRRSDGDLDIVRRLDLGAFEFQPFEVVGETRIGARIELVFHGEPGSSAVLFLSSRRLKDPLATPFGEAFRPFWRATLPFAAGPGSVSHTFSLRAPAHLAGTTISLQALTGSSAAPAGRAYTNAVSFKLEP